MKSNYSIKESKDKYNFTYSGDLGEALEKAKKDLQKEKENPDIPHWLWIKSKAEKAIKAHNNRIRRIQAFIDCAERHLKAEKEEVKTGNE